MHFFVKKWSKPLIFGALNFIAFFCYLDKVQIRILPKISPFKHDMLCLDTAYLSFFPKTEKWT